MKENLKIFITAISFIIVFALLLSGAFYSFAAAPVPSHALTKDDFNPLMNLLGNPTPQQELRDKFLKMSAVTETEGKRSITVITEETLKEMWDDMTDDDYKINSLSVDEVLFIISDSIRLYNEYDEIVLCGYGDEVYLSSLEKFSALVKPELEENIVVPIHDLDSYRINISYKIDDSRYRIFLPGHFNSSSIDENYTEEEMAKIIESSSKQAAYRNMIRDIYKIITYRITALSSPSCFTNTSEVENEPITEWINTNILEFYLPEYSDTGDRSAVMKQLKSNALDYFSFRFDELFPRIHLVTNNEGKQRSVFPTTELELANPTQTSSFRHKFIVDNSIPVENALTTTYMLQDLQNFFGNISQNEILLGYSLPENKSALTFDSVNETFPIECFRQNHAGYYSVYKVDEGGYFYVFWRVFYTIGAAADYYPKVECANVYFTAYLSPSRNLIESDFDSIKENISTAHDVSLIDPEFEVTAYTPNAVILSYSLLSDRSVLQIMYGEDTGEIRSRKELVVKSKEIISTGKVSLLYSVFSEDLP